MSDDPSQPELLYSDRDSKVVASYWKSKGISYKIFGAKSKETTKEEVFEAMDHFLVNIMYLKWIFIHYSGHGTVSNDVSEAGSMCFKDQNLEVYEILEYLMT